MERRGEAENNFEIDGEGGKSKSKSPETPPSGGRETKAGLTGKEVDRRHEDHRKEARFGCG